MKEGFAFGYDPEDIKKVTEELSSLNDQISRLEGEYKTIEHGPANEARMQIENKLISLKERRKKLEEELFSVGLSNDAVLKSIFRGRIDQEDVLE